MKINPKESKRYADNLVYVYDRSRYHIFKVHRVCDEFVYAKRFTLHPYRVPHVRLPWHEVGVFQAGDLQEGTFKLRRSDLDGKAILAAGVLSTCGRNVLFDY